MKRVAMLALVVLVAVTAQTVARPDPPALMVQTAQGVIQKVEKDSISVQPRRPDGKFDKVVVVKLTGTSTISQASTRDSAGKISVVQKAMEVRDLRAGQNATIVYATMKDDNVLLSAVVLPADK